MNRLSGSPLVIRALQIAETELGIQELSRRLGASEETISLWRMDRVEMPHGKWLKLVDILLELRPNSEWREGGP